MNSHNYVLAANFFIFSKNKFKMPINRYIIECNAKLHKVEILVSKTPKILAETELEIVLSQDYYNIYHKKLDNKQKSIFEINFLLFLFEKV